MPTSSPVKPANGNMQAFELAFSAAARDGLLSSAEIDMLANLAVTLGLDADMVEGRARVLARAQSTDIPTES